jgi:YVTN family beta-propeller protein
MLCLLLLGSVLIAVPQSAAPDTTPVGTIVIAGTAIRAVTPCNDALGNTKAVYAISQQRNNRTFLHAADPVSRKLLGAMITRATAPALVEVQYLADAVGLALSSDCRTAYTVGYSDGNVYAYSLPDPSALASLPAAQVVGRLAVKIAACKSPGEDKAPGAEDLALWEAGRKLLVACSSTNKVAVIDLTTNKLSAELVVGELPRAVAVYTQGATNRAYTANFGGDSLSVIDLNNNSVSTRPISAKPFNVLANSANPLGFLSTYYLSQGDNRAGSVIPSTGDVTAEVEVCDTPRGLMLDPRGQALFVTCSGVNDGRSGIARVRPNGAVAYTRTAELLERYATFVCVSENAKCDARYELWSADLAGRGAIQIYDGNKLK